MLLRNLLKKNLKKLKPRKSKMEVLIPLAIMVLIVALSMRNLNLNLSFGKKQYLNLRSKFKSIVMAAKPRPTTADVAANLHAHEVKM
jgi:hypothetical protein